MDKDTIVLDKKQINSPKNVYNYSEFNSDKNYIINLLYDVWGLSFEGLRCVETNSIAIHQRKGIWFVKKFNDTKYTNLPAYANFEGLVYALTKHIQNGKERITAQQDIITRCTGFSLPTANNLPEKQPKPRKTQNKGLNVEFCDLTNEALDYFARKGGITKGTLERYGIKTVSRLFGRAEFYPSFGWNVGDNIKVKRPLHPYKKYAQSRGKMPYIFGWYQLPATGQTLIICAGETDCLCINEHGNGAGVWAICLNSENDRTTLTERIINDLKTRFERVFIVYDADATGEEYSKELALKTGFIRVNTLFYASWGNDVCEFWANGWGVLEFVNHFTKLFRCTRINAVETDKFSLDIPFVYELDFYQYLGENNSLNTIKDLLCIEKRLAIQSPAGTGKSTMILELCREYGAGGNFVKQRLKLDKTIVAAPTTAIGLQLQKDFEKKGVSVSIIYGEIKGEDLEVSRYDSLIITTYDSIKYLSEFIPDSLLIIDEFHQIANDYDYRKNAMGCIWESMGNAPQILLLSATPNYLFCSHIAPFFNFSLLVGKPQKTNTISLSFLKHAQSKKYLNDYIEENAPTSGGTICIKYDSNNTLETYYKHDLERGLVVEHFTSKSRERKEENDNYNSIMETGKPTQRLDKLYFTTLLEAGVSLKFPIDLVAIFDVKSWSKIVQLATRPRLHKDGEKWVNTIVNVWVFDSRNGNKNTPKNEENLKQRWEKYYKEASENAAFFNGRTGGGIDHKTTSDFRNFCHQANGNWVVNVPAILHELFKQETSETELNTLIQRIKRFDNRFEIGFVGDVNGMENADLAELLEQTKAEKEADKMELVKLLNSQPTNTIQAICKLSKDKELKATAKTALSLPLVEKEVINELIRANPAAFNTGENNRILRDLVFLVGDGGNDLATAIQKIANQSKKELTLERDTHQRKERIKTYKNNPKEQSSEARAQVEREKAICLKFKYILNNIQKGKRKNEFTASELAKIVNSALDSVVLDGKAIRTPKKIGEKAVISYLSQFYELEQKRTGETKGRIRFYSILKVKKLG